MCLALLRDILIFPSGGAALAAGVLGGLLLCFLGYVLFRLVVAAEGAMIGVLLGAAMVRAWRPEASTADYVVICGAAAIVLAIFGWFLYRLTFSCWAGLWTCAGIIEIFGQSTASLTAGILIGAAIAIAAFIFLRQMVIAATSLCGAAAAVFAAGAIFGLPAWNSDGAAPARQWVIAVSAGLSLALGIVGIIAQTKLAGAVRHSLAPPNRRRRRGGGGRSPGFARLR